MQVWGSQAHLPVPNTVAQGCWDKMYFNISATVPAPPTTLPSVLNITSQMSPSSTASQEKGCKREYHQTPPLLPPHLCLCTESPLFSQPFWQHWRDVWWKKTLTKVKHAGTSSLLKGKLSGKQFSFPQQATWEGHFFRKQLNHHHWGCVDLASPPCLCL